MMLCLSSIEFRIVPDSLFSGVIRCGYLFLPNHNFQPLGSDDSVSVGHQLENDGIYIEREDYYEMKDKLVKLVTDTLNKKGYDFS